MILVIDNYDSFTYNLVQLMGGLGADVEVRRNDALDLPTIETMAPERIVVSPGPGTPADAGISVEVIRHFGPTTPTLGVCLGHQAIGTAYGGRVVRARRPMHGKVSPVAHEAQGPFQGVPNPVPMTRYHSLILEPDSLPEELEVIAWAEEEGWDDEIQAVRHIEHPVWGVQFHPESVASEHGDRILRNFMELSA